MSLYLMSDRIKIDYNFKNPHPEVYFRIFIAYSVFVYRGFIIQTSKESELQTYFVVMFSRFPMGGLDFIVGTMKFQYLIISIMSFSVLR